MHMKITVTPSSTYGITVFLNGQYILRWDVEEQGDYKWIITEFIFAYILTMNANEDTKTITAENIKKS